ARETRAGAKRGCLKQLCATTILKNAGPLFPEKIMIAIKDYLDKEVAIDKAVDNQEKSIFEAYDSLYNEQEKLHGILINYVKEIARI
ncbi:hypothetical protein Q7I34_16415, partial [Aeromonas veronii]|uniref:hypothetical protein n=1 Tax=Aeromonas veronii TaxID=654 RepID=UPI003007AAF0